MQGWLRSAMEVKKKICSLCLCRFLWKMDRSMCAKAAGKRKMYGCVWIVYVCKCRGSDGTIDGTIEYSELDGSYRGHQTQPFSWLCTGHPQKSHHISERISLNFLNSVRQLVWRILVLVAFGKRHFHRFPVSLELLCK